MKRLQLLLFACYLSVLFFFRVCFYEFSLMLESAEKMSCRRFLKDTHSIV